MTSVKLTACGFLLAFGLAMSAQAHVANVTIADFNGDYVPGAQGQTRVEASADGWNYMWNDGAHDWGGPIGMASKYETLKYCSASLRYTPTGAYPAYYPGYYVYINSTGGMTGEGTQQIGTSDSFVIAAYTVQDDEAGDVSIAESSFGVPAAASNGVELRVYVNDTLKTSFVQAGGASASSFDISLGSLAVGDTVYVAAGPNGINYNDAFDLSYKLASQMPSIPGDANDDRKVDSTDAAILADNWLYGDDLNQATWEMGDFNGDYKVDDMDATILAANWHTGVPTAVPEPSVTLGLLCMGLATLATVCRRRV